MKMLKKALCAVFAGAVMLSAAAVTASAGSSGYLTVNGKRAAKISSAGTYTMINTGDPSTNAAALQKALSGNSKRKVVLPKGTYRIDKGITVGSNKTLVATGVKVIQTDPQRQLINNACTKVNYGSLSNVSIEGGTWYISGNEKMLRDTSTIRFNHANNIKLRNCTIYTNFRSHGVEFIACRNVGMYKCKVITKGTAPKDCIEEAVQIDVATAKTAPTCASVGDKFVKGQTCENIRLEGCIISGGRAVCCNKTDTENNKYSAKMHRNITVVGCTLKGLTAEGLVLHNVHGFTVKNNTIISYCKNKEKLYSCGINAMVFGKFGDYGKYKNVISGNTVKGTRFAVSVGSRSGAGGKYGTVTVTGNKLYCTRGKNYVLHVTDVSKYVHKGNSAYKWA